MNEWEQRFLAFVKKGALDSSFLGDIDAFLMWFSSFPDAQDGGLSKQLLAQVGDTPVIRADIYTLIDDVFFRQSYLFYGCKGDSKAVKTRYFRLMQLYHPDRAQMEQAWTTRRCELINSAYSAAKSELVSKPELGAKAVKAGRAPSVQRDPSGIKAESTPPIKVNLSERLQAQKKARWAKLKYFFKRQAMQVKFSTIQLRNRVLFLLSVLSLSIMSFLYWSHQLESREIEKIGFTYASTAESTAEYDKRRSIEEEVVRSSSIDDLVASPKPPIAFDADSEDGSFDIAYEDRILIENLLSRWSDAWSNRDVDLYFSFYAKDFMPKDSDSFNRWRSKRKSLLNNKKFIRVRLRDLVLSKQDDSIKAEFLQYYLSDTLADKVRKELVLVQEKNDWKIISELAN